MTLSYSNLRAIWSVSDAFVMVRTRDNTPSAIKPMLDAGFDGIMVADVRTPEEARAIAEAARYAPAGRRGAHFTVSRAEARIRHSGKLLRGAALPGVAIPDLFARGYSLVTGASDVGSLRDGALRHVQCK